MILHQDMPSSSLPPFRREEILRYAGAKAESPALSRLLEEAMEEARTVLCCRVCWQEVPVSFRSDCVELGTICGSGESLRCHLAGCEKAVLFATTIGIGLDRLIARYGAVAPAKALLLQAIGAERIEALCDSFCAALQQNAEANQLHTTARFSPGYGDLPLEFQKDLFRVLDCPRTIGLTLNESLLMSPSKSVTAIVGLGAQCRNHTADRCRHCRKTDCIYRRHL